MVKLLLIQIKVDCSDRCQPVYMNKRLDRLSAVLIDAVLNNWEAQGTVSAARVMAENGVPLHVAVRVLTRPWERRGHIAMLPAASPA